jgi:hypothetical protein
MHFSKAAYGDFDSELNQEYKGYTEIKQVRFSSAGFSGRAYKNGTQIVLAITGSDSIVDWLDVNGTFISPNGTPTRAFRDYVGYAAQMLKFVYAEFHGANITITGHSLGGAIAQVIGNAGGWAVTSFDAPGAAQTLEDADLTAILRTVPKSINAGPITNYRVYGDLVSTVGEQLTKDVRTYEPPIAKFLVDAFPVESLKPMHSRDLMMDRIANAATTLDFGPTAASVLVTRATLVDLVVALDRGLLGLDPGGMNGYAFHEDSSSPRVRSIIFPLLLNSEALFNLELFQNDRWSSVSLLQELQTYDFGALGVDQFKFFILDYDTGAPLTNVEEFTLGLTFAQDGIVNGQLVSVSAVPEPPMIWTFILGLTALYVIQYRVRFMRVLSGA